MGWNDEIPEVNKRDWLELIEETVTEGPLSFPRSMRPPNPVNGPMIDAFLDRLFHAYQILYSQPVFGLLGRAFVRHIRLLITKKGQGTGLEELAQIRLMIHIQ